MIETIKHVMQDTETGKLYVDIEVVDKVYKLICDQRIFFATRDKKLLKSCKEREDGFVKWYSETMSLVAQFINEQTTPK